MAVRRQGEWREDKMNGDGTFSFGSGAVYKGRWADNQFVGEGTYTWPDNTSYTGGWADNTCAAGAAGPASRRVRAITHCRLAQDARKGHVYR